MDNASSHRKQIVKDNIKNKNKYFYILPYHHDLNVIEKYFNQLKYYVKLEEPMNYDEIK